ncbi:MAG: hypothetical protein ACF8MF_06740 [Phycisphaerales bacterium JB052]
MHSYEAASKGFADGRNAARNEELYRSSEAYADGYELGNAVRLAWPQGMEWEVFGAAEGLEGELTSKLVPFIVYMELHERSAYIRLKSGGRLIRDQRLGSSKSRYDAARFLLAEARIELQSELATLASVLDK